MSNPRLVSRLLEARFGARTDALVRLVGIGHVPYIEYFLAFCPQLSLMEHGKALLLASINGNVEAFHILFNNCNDILRQQENCMYDTKWRELVSQGTYTRALVFSCLHGHTSIVRILLESPFGPRANYHGGAPLLVATSYGHINIVRLILAAEHLPFEDCGYACEQGNVEIVLQILTHPTAPPADCCEGSTLMLAVMRGHYETVKALLEFPAGPRADCQDGYALLLACANGHVGIVRLLLESHAPPRVDCWDGEAMILACRNGHADVARLLVDFSRGTDTEGITWCRNGAPMLYACRFGLPEVVHVLIEAIQPTHVTT
eukprot:gene28533-31691_t